MFFGIMLSYLELELSDQKQKIIHQSETHRENENIGHSRQKFHSE